MLSDYTKNQNCHIYRTSSNHAFPKGTHNVSPQNSHVTQSSLENFFSLCLKNLPPVFFYVHTPAHIKKIFSNVPPANKIHTSNEVVNNKKKTEKNHNPSLLLFFTMTMYYFIFLYSYLLPAILIFLVTDHRTPPKDKIQTMIPKKNCT